MKLKNVLIVVKDIERSQNFYHELFGLDVVVNNDGNMILTEGLVLQDEKYGRIFSAGMFLRKAIPVSCILRSGMSRDLSKNLRKYILP